MAFGLAALVAGLIVLPENSDPDAHRVDIPGTVLGAAALTALVFGVIRGENRGFTSPSVLSLLGLSARGRGGVLLVGEPGRSPPAGPAVPAGAAVPHR